MFVGRTVAQLLYTFVRLRQLPMLEHSSAAGPAIQHCSDSWQVLSDQTVSQPVCQTLSALSDILSSRYRPTGSPCAKFRSEVSLCLALTAVRHCADSGVLQREMLRMRSRGKLFGGPQSNDNLQPGKRLGSKRWMEKTTYWGASRSVLPTRYYSRVKSRTT
jgi:hypothetical protein